MSSYAIEDGDRLLLFDLLALPSEIEEFAAGRETAIVLTWPWLRRERQPVGDRCPSTGGNLPAPRPEVCGNLAGRVRA